jgi:hypothetical protein
MRHFPKVLLSSLLLASLATSACRPSTNRYGQTTNASSLAEEQQSSPHQPAKNSSYWVNVGSTSNGSLIDVDTNSIQINGSSAIYFTRMRHSSPPNGVSITAVHEVMDCRSGLYQSLEYMSFSNQGRMIGRVKNLLPYLRPSLEHYRQEFTVWFVVRLQLILIQLLTSKWQWNHFV